MSRKKTRYTDLQDRFLLWGLYILGITSILTAVFDVSPVWQTPLVLLALILIITLLNPVEEIKTNVRYLRDTRSTSARTFAKLQSFYDELGRSVSEASTKVDLTHIRDNPPEDFGIEAGEYMQALEQWVEADDAHSSSPDYQRSQRADVGVGKASQVDAGSSAWIPRPCRRLVNSSPRPEHGHCGRPRCVPCLDRRGCPAYERVRGRRFNDGCLLLRILRSSLECWGGLGRIPCKGTLGLTRASNGQPCEPGWTRYPVSSRCERTWSVRRREASKGTRGNRTRRRCQDIRHCVVLRA